MTSSNGGPPNKGNPGGGGAGQSDGDGEGAELIRLPGTRAEADAQNLDHLAPPDRLGGGKHFIVWAKDDKGRWNRVGALKYDEKERHGTLEGASANQHSFDLMITVEGDIRGESPSGEAIYSQHIN